ncbi:MAG: serine protease [Deltaproteobacteria bacterium]|jgi:S1-C subfamily serine protease|nr:serine protease [Deltaproteobacteria bacterium]
MAEITSNLQTEQLGAEPRKRRYLSGLILGLALAAAGFWLLYHYFFASLLYNAQVASLNYNLFQNSSTESLKGITDKYKAALKAGDICLLPAMEEAQPFFAPGQDAPAEEEKNARPMTAEARQRAMIRAVDSSAVLILARGATAEGRTFWTSGTGFFIGPDLVLTNRQTVAGLGPEGMIKVANRFLGKALEAEVAAVSRLQDFRDYAVLKVSPEGSRKPQSLKISRAARRGEQIRTWGYAGIEDLGGPEIEAMLEGDLSSLTAPVYTDGTVSLIDLSRDPQLIGHTAHVFPGSGGGPLISRTGQVLGLLSWVTVDRKSGRAVNLAFAGGDLLDFLKENGISQD